MLAQQRVSPPMDSSASSVPEPDYTPAPVYHLPVCNVFDLLFQRNLLSFHQSSELVEMIFLIRLLISTHQCRFLLMILELLTIISFFII